MGGARRAARSKRQAVIEFQEITRRHGLTPIEFLHDVGLLNRPSCKSFSVRDGFHPRAADGTNVRSWEAPSS